MRRRREPKDLWTLANRHPRTTSWSVAMVTVSTVLVIMAFIFIHLPIRQQVTITVRLGQDVVPEAPVALTTPESPEPDKVIEEPPKDAEPAADAPDNEEVQEPPDAELPTNQQDTADGESGDGESTPENEANGQAAHAEEAIAETRSRVQRHGGKRGVITVSLIWDGPSDLDLHVYIRGRHRQPELDCSVKEHIFYREPQCMWAELDVDANRDEAQLIDEPCENVFSTAPPHLGKYAVNVQLFQRRNEGPIPFTVVLEYGDQTEVCEGIFAANERSKHTHRAAQFQFRHEKVYRVGYGGGYRSGSAK